MPLTRLGISIQKFLSTNQRNKSLGKKKTETLNFDENVESLCREIGMKLFVLARLSNFMFTNKKRVFMKAYIESQLAYCPLIWKLRSKVFDTIYMNNHYKLSTRATLDFPEIRGTFNDQLQNHIKLKEIFLTT